METLKQTSKLSTSDFPTMEMFVCCYNMLVELRADEYLSDKHFKMKLFEMKLELAPKLLYPETYDVDQVKRLIDEIHQKIKDL